MAVLGGRARIFSRTGKKKGNSRGVPLLTSIEAWKLDSGAKVTGRIEMAEGSVRS